MSEELFQFLRLRMPNATYNLTFFETAVTGVVEMFRADDVEVIRNMLVYRNTRLPVSQKDNFEVSPRFNASRVRARHRFNNLTRHEPWAWKITKQYACIYIFSWIPSQNLFMKTQYGARKLNGFRFQWTNHFQIFILLHPPSN